MSARTAKRILPAAVLLALWAGTARAELLVGTAGVSITPPLPVAVSGQFPLRVAKTVESPVTANAIALESRRNGEAGDAAVLVSCDLVYITQEVRNRLRREVKKRVPDLDPAKIILFATHSHTAPVLKEDVYTVPEGVMQPRRYVTFLVERLAGAVAQAWKNRKPGSVTWGLGDAVVAYNRRAVYSDGRARMYGRTDTPDFKGLEGYEDHDINTLFFWNNAGELIATLVNVSCPAQEVESRRAINADFWHPVREKLRKRFGRELRVLGSVGAAGDQSPHLMYRKAADERMRRLRGLTRLEEIARRIVRAVEETYDAVKNDRHRDPPLIHRVAFVKLPMRTVTESEYREAKTEVEKAAAAIRKDPKAAERLHMRLKWYEGVVKRFERQRTDPKPTCGVEIHAVRIGDAAVCTNRFELFTEFGIRIKGRSRAVQTIVIQLAGPGTYLPTAKAVRGGHYSAVVESNLVGPEGGKILVDRTVELVNSMWESRKE